MAKLTDEQRAALKALNVAPLGWHGSGALSARALAWLIRDGLAMKRRDEFGNWFHITEAGRTALKEQEQSS